MFTPVTLELHETPCSFLILFLFYFSGLKLFSFIAQNWLKDDKIEEVKALAKYLDEDVLKDFVASSDLEVQERASGKSNYYFKISPLDGACLQVS